MLIFFGLWPKGDPKSKMQQPGILLVTLRQLLSTKTAEIFSSALTAQLAQNKQKYKIQLSIYIIILIYSTYLGYITLIVFQSREVSQGHRIDFLLRKGTLVSRSSFTNGTTKWTSDQSMSKYFCYILQLFSRQPHCFLQRQTTKKLKGQTTKKLP